VVLATYNDELFIRSFLEHAFAHGLFVHVIDNCSTDATLEIVGEYLGRGVIELETFPRTGPFNWRSVLSRKEEVAIGLDADWVLHAAADEVQLPPRPSQRLADALAGVDKAGYNVVNFQEYTFVPTVEEPDHEHPRWHETMRRYYPFLPRFPHQLRAWKSQTIPVDIVSSGGHEVKFAGRRLYPESFPMRHYQFLSVPHAMRKYVERTYDPGEVEHGWHGWRATIRADQIRLPHQEQLRLYSGDESLDASKPWKKHALELAAS
jgi:glycosyltransferase involved in cell wall biosynthesis